MSLYSLFPVSLEPADTRQKRIGEEMAYDRPSWKEIDKSKDRPSHMRRRDRTKKDLTDHSTRYDKYKSDLNRLFDQGMAGELLKKPGKEKPPVRNSRKTKSDPVENQTPIRKGNGRIPRDSSAVINRFKLTKTIIDATQYSDLVKAIDDLVDRFGLIDDWEVLMRILEHPNEELVLQAVEKMSDLLERTPKITRKLSLKERLRTISQTASQRDLRQQAIVLEQRL